MSIECILQPDYDSDSAPQATHIVLISRLMEAHSVVQARLGLARPVQGSMKSKPEPQAAKSPSRPKPWAQATALST